MENSKRAFIFPGQGAQYQGMGKDFYYSFSIAKEVYQEADDLLQRNLSKIVFEGPDDLLTETKNSQLGIFVTCVAILQVMRHEFPHCKATYCAGLSLGEYTALYASDSIDFKACLDLVQHRGEFMNDACESTRGAMAVVLGLDAAFVETVVGELNMPKDLWVANFNCPGQVVISGTLRGIEAGTVALTEKGAKRVMPLQVHGAFHSGLMEQAKNRLKPYIEAAPIKGGSAQFVMNVPGKIVSDLAQIKKNLIDQVTQPVRWEQSIRTLNEEGVDLFIEIGSKTLTGFNKRIGTVAPTINIETTKDLTKLVG